MNPESIYQRLATGKLTPEGLTARVEKEPSLVPVLVAGMEEPQAKVKYGAAKALRGLVDERPELLYGYFDRFATMLRHPTNIFKWEAIYLLAGMTSIDTDHNLERIWQEYFAPLEGPGMITAANIAKATAVIGSARPELGDRLATELLRTEHGKYETLECYEIVAGQTLRSLGKILPLLSDLKAVAQYARRRTKSHRAATRKSAESLLAKIDRARARLN